MRTGFWFEVVRRLWKCLEFPHFLVEGALDLAF